MQRKNHKMLAGLLAGAVLLAGGVGLYHVQATPAAAQTQTLQGREQRPQPDMDKVAAYMAKTFGVDEDEIRQALRDHSDFRDVGYAAMLARISGKPFQDVLAMKTESNHWRDVREQLGVTPKQEHEMHESRRRRCWPGSPVSRYRMSWIARKSTIAGQMSLRNWG